MDFKTTGFEEIDIEDETYRISEDLDSASVMDSLKNIGQLNPVLLLDQNPLKIVVCGFRRIRALIKLGESRVFARILPKEGYDSLHGFELSLWDNLSHRRLNPLENSRLLYKLSTVCGLAREILIKTYLPLMGLEPHESVLESYLRLNDAHPELRRCLANDRLTISSVDTLAGMPYAIQGRIAMLMGRISLSASLQRKILDLLVELSAVTEAPVDAPLDYPQARSILEDSRLSPHQKGERLHAVLYRVKNPRISAAMARFQGNKKQLALPGSIRITPHQFFETADLRVEFQAASSERFRDMVAALHKAAQSPKLEELFRSV